MSADLLDAPPPWCSRCRVTRTPDADGLCSACRFDQRWDRNREGLAVGLECVNCCARITRSPSRLCVGCAAIYQRAVDHVPDDEDALDAGRWVRGRNGVMRWVADEPDEDD